MPRGDAREGKWRENWRMEWVASTLHTTLEHGVSSITTADANTTATSSRLNWRLRRFKWTRPFRRKTKSGFYTCAITFQLASTESCCFSVHCVQYILLAENNVEATLLHLSGHGRRHCPSKYRKCRIGQTRNWFLTPGPVTCYRVHLSWVSCLCLLLVHMCQHVNGTLPFFLTFYWPCISV